MSVEKYQSGLFNDRCRVLFFQFNPSIIFGWCRRGNVQSASSADSFYFRPGSGIFPGRQQLSFSCYLLLLVFTRLIVQSTLWFGWFLQYLLWEEEEEEEEHLRVLYVYYCASVEIHSCPFIFLFFIFAHCSLVHYYIKVLKVFKFSKKLKLFPICELGLLDSVLPVFMVFFLCIVY